ncbi:hypothetical protein Salat_1967000 [Sesamum alatum]|uniref:Signal recognition particle receptor subunit beta n=1 Tax=Sesamum alatum TaxID=300844 RepID=A0AAE1Y611_9LAMI|nr:hypothetical protein Salat_1967000 [Sesamum alatum]
MDEEKMEKLRIQLQELFNETQDFVQKIPPMQLYAAIGVVISTIFLFLIIRLFKRKSSNTIVLTGLSGSGKTVLFYQLRDGSSHQGTVTSMEPNEGTFVLHSETTKKGKIKPVHIVDVPGHSRLRPKLDEFLPQAAGIVFVVDAVEFLPNVRAASEYLYDILTKASVVKKKIPLLLLCNKVDKVTAHTKDFIRKQLEKEIDKLRASRTALSSADITNEYTLGVPGEAFAFHQCYNKVTVAEASGLTGDTYHFQIVQPRQSCESNEMCNGRGSRHVKFSSTILMYVKLESLDHQIPHPESVAIAILGGYSLFSLDCPPCILSAENHTFVIEKLDLMIFDWFETSHLLPCGGHVYLLMVLSHLSSGLRTLKLTSKPKPAHD